MPARIVTGVKVEPFCTTVNSDGTVATTRSSTCKNDSPYKTMEDLKGKNLGLVDPNSTSGNNVPRFLLNKQKINAETSSRTSPRPAATRMRCIALQQKTVDVAANWWNAEDDFEPDPMAPRAWSRRRTSASSPSRT